MRYEIKSKILKFQYLPIRDVAPQKNILSFNYLVI